MIDVKKQTARISLIVRDDYRNRGGGTAIIDYIVSTGIHEGIPEITSTMMRENEKMISLTGKTPFTAHRRTVGGAVPVAIPPG